MKNSFNVTDMHLCIVGNMMGQEYGQIPSQGLILGRLLESEGLTITKTSPRINRATRFVAIICQLVFGFQKFDLVVLEVYSGLYFFVAMSVAFVCTILRLPLIMVLHGGDLPRLARNRPWLATLVFSQAKRLIAPSPYLQASFQELGYPVKVIPNTIDISQMKYRERSVISPNILWMRSFHEVYNPEMAIKVLDKLKQDFPNATLTMAGNDKGTEPAVRALANELGLSQSVRFVGFLDEKQKSIEFARADIYINTNRIDNMPVSVLEARYMGLPVVSTDVGGLPFIIDHGVNGLIGPSDNAEKMVGNIVRLLKSPELTKRISRNGREIAKRSSWPLVFEEWKRLFNETLKKQSQSRAFSSNAA